MSLDEVVPVWIGLPGGGMICYLSSEEDRMLIGESFVGDGGGAPI
jgi:hypothetical protein